MGRLNRTTDELNKNLLELDKLKTEFESLDKDIGLKPGKIIDGGEIFNDESNTVDKNGVNNHAEGQGTQCVGSCNHAEGMNTYASVTASHAEGNSTVAGAAASHAEGLGTGITVEAGHVEGKYNKVTDSVHVVGGGTSNTDRKNLHEIDKDGNQYMIGIGGFDGTNRDNSVPLNKVVQMLTQEEYDSLESKNENVFYFIYEEA